MFASSGTRAVRGTFRGPLVRPRHPTRHTGVRFQSTSPQSAGSVATHVAAGLAGGAFVVAAGKQTSVHKRLTVIARLTCLRTQTGYGWYHFSDVKKFVDSMKSVKDSMKDYYGGAKDSLKKTASKPPNEVLNYVRDLAKPYVALIPGGQKAVNEAFDAVQDIIDTHGDEVNDILDATRNELQEALKGQDTFSAATGMKVAGIMQVRLGQLSDIAQKAGEKGIKSLSEKYPQVSEKLGGAYEHMRKLAEKAGPEAQKIVDDTTKQVIVTTYGRVGFWR